MNASAGAENIRIMAVFECRHQTETVESFGRAFLCVGKKSSRFGLEML
jgi:hypothetical protein